MAARRVARNLAHEQNAFQVAAMPLAFGRDMEFKLSTLAIVMGLGLSVPQIYGLAKPAGFAAAARKFPRSVPIGAVLMMLATGWFLYYLNLESNADFAKMKQILMAVFAVVGLG